MLFYISLWISKLYLYLFKRNSTDDTTGMLACKIDRDFLKHVAKPPTVICVTGTNGKTTTCNFICDFLEKSGFKVAANKEGANLRPGISKALLKTVTIFNQSKADFAVIEFDELSSAELLKDLKPQYVIVTNLSSDTMKRNGHTDYVFARIKAGLNDDMTLILNGDDLISCQLGKDKNAFYFSIKEQPNDKTKTIPFSKDIRLCPVCDSELIFDYVRYNHIGKAHCPKCGFSNPAPDFLLEKIDLESRQITINSENYHLIDPNLTNIYNELTLISLLKLLKISSIDPILKDLKVTKTRFDKESINGIEIITQMAKGQNPVAVSRSLEYIKEMSGKKALIIILDDMLDKNAYHTTCGEAINWIYETDFSFLEDDSIKEIVVGGNNYADFKMRFNFLDLKDKVHYCNEESDTYKYLKLEDIDKVVILRDIYMGKIAKEIIANIKEMLK